MKTILPFFFILFIATSCSPLGKIIYGYRDLKYLDENGMEKWNKRVAKQGVEYGALDTSYAAYAISVSADKYFRKAMSQPIVIFKFINDSCTFLSANCYYPGLPNLNWNNGTLDTFSKNFELHDSLISKIKYQLLIATSNYNSSNKIAGERIVILCGNTLRRQSRRLIQLLKKIHPAIPILVCNNDNALYYLLSSDEMLKAYF